MASKPNQPRSVIVIGAGIAGLSAGIYAQLNGFQTRIYEMHDLPGGLMTAWKRKGYTIDGCIHWLSGSSMVYPEYYRWWQEIGLIQDREIFDPEIFTRIEGRDGKVLNLYTDIDRLEKHLLELGPEDEAVIRSFCSSLRKFSRFQMTTPDDLLGRITSMIKMVPMLPQFTKWGKLSMGDFGNLFKNPFLHESFSSMWYPEMSSMALFITLAMMHNKGAGYTLGGSLPMALAVEKRFCSLGGQIFYDSRVEKICIENGQAVGVVICDKNGVQSEQRADIVISAADGYATLYKLLDGRYLDEPFKKLYDGTQPIFPPILHVGLGVNRRFEDIPAMTGGLSILLDEPLQVAGQSVDRLDTMIYNFDPALAPAGKTALNVMVSTSYTYWKELFGDGANREQYDAEKQRVAIEIIHRLGRRFPGLEDQVEMADVATPLTFERYTGNWQGSYEGWLPTPKSVRESIPKTLSGLENFYMVGQWVQAGGGLPSGVMTGRQVVRMICKQAGKKFCAEI